MNIQKKKPLDIKFMFFFFKNNVIIYAFKILKD